MADLASQLNQLKTFKLDGRNKLIAGLVAACAVVSIIVVALMSKGPEYGPLYTNLAETDAAEITAKLKEDGVSYQIADEGRTIEVPKDQVYDVRMTLASEGLPQGQGVGYEIFDKSSFGQTDFTQRLNYIRALQGELTRTIMNLSPIESARVHLVVPEDDEYLDEQQTTPTASVVVKIKAGTGLTKAQVRGITHLVAGSVSGLTSENVTVVDTSGNILSDQTDATTDVENGFSTVQAAYENRLQRSIESMIDRVLGPGRAVVRVTAELDMDRLERNSELYEPLAGSNTGVIRTQSQVIESSNNTASGGPTGLSANGGETTLNPGIGSNSSRTENSTAYEISKQVERVVRNPGGVKRLNVSVLVDGIERDRLASIRQAVVAASGADFKRGDSVVVESMEFTNADLEMPSEQEKQPLSGFNLNLSKAYQLYAAIGAAALVVLVILLMLIKKLRSRKKKKKKTDSDEVIAELAGLPGQAAAGENPTLGMIGPLHHLEEAAALNDNEQRKSELYARVEEQIKKDAKGAALLLRGWLSEEE